MHFLRRYISWIWVWFKALSSSYNVFNASKLFFKSIISTPYWLSTDFKRNSWSSACLTNVLQKSRLSRSIFISASLCLFISRSLLCKLSLSWFMVTFNIEISFSRLVFIFRSSSNSIRFVLVRLLISLCNWMFLSSVLLEKSRKLIRIWFKFSFSDSNSKHFCSNSA